MNNVVNIVPKMQPSERIEDGARKASLRFEKEVKHLHAAMEEQIHSRVPRLEEIARYSLLGQGKRLRPLLFVLSARMCGARDDDVYRYAGIFEAIHAASLLHDDVLDNAEFRRKKPSAGRVWGNHAAVIGGDFLFSKFMGLALECGKFPFLETLIRATTSMAEGQMLEASHTNNWSLHRGEYMEIITAKTAVLISAACSCGAIFAGAGEGEIERLGRFGLSLGTAFQLIDDLLDYTSTQEVFGKPVGKDLREGKITLPLILTLARMGQEEAAALKARFQEVPFRDEDVDMVIRRVRDAGGLDEIHEEARSYATLAEQALMEFPDSPVQQDLITLNRQLLARSF